MITTQQIRTFLGFDNIENILSKYQELEEDILFQKGLLDELIDDYKAAEREYNSQIELNDNNIKKSNSKDNLYFDNKIFLQQRYDRFFSNYIDDVKKIKDKIEKAQYIQSKLIKRNPELEKVVKEIAKKELAFQIIEKAYEEGKVNKEQYEVAKTLMHFTQPHKKIIIKEKDKKIQKAKLNELEEGKKVEKEHIDTYNRIKKYLKENDNKLPLKEEVQKWIAEDHLKEFPNYYTELKKMEEKLKNNKDE